MNWKIVRLFSSRLVFCSSVFLRTNCVPMDMNVDIIRYWLWYWKTYRICTLLVFISNSSPTGSLIEKAIKSKFISLSRDMSRALISNNLEDRICELLRLDLYLNDHFTNKLFTILVLYFYSLYYFWRHFKKDYSILQFLLARNYLGMLNKFWTNSYKLNLHYSLIRAVHIWRHISGGIQLIVTYYFNSPILCSIAWQWRWESWRYFTV